MENRYVTLSKAEDFYYRENGILKAAEKVIMFGGEDQALLDCYGVWAVVNVSDIYLPNELTQEEIVEYYERESGGDALSDN